MTAPGRTRRAARPERARGPARPGPRADDPDVPRGGGHRPGPEPAVRDAGPLRPADGHAAPARAARRRDRDAGRRDARGPPARPGRHHVRRRVRQRARGGRPRTAAARLHRHLLRHLRAARRDQRLGRGHARGRWSRPARCASSRPPGWRSARTAPRTSGWPAWTAASCTRRSAGAGPGWASSPARRSAASPTRTARWTPPPARGAPGGLRLRVRRAEPAGRPRAHGAAQDLRRPARRAGPAGGQAARVPRRTSQPRGDAREGPARHHRSGRRGRRDPAGADPEVHQARQRRGDAVQPRAGGGPDPGRGDQRARPRDAAQHPAQRAAEAAVDHRRGPLRRGPHAPVPQPDLRPPGGPAGRHPGRADHRALDRRDAHRAAQDDRRGARAVPGLGTVLRRHHRRLRHRPGTAHPLGRARAEDHRHPQRAGHRGAGLRPGWPASGSASSSASRRTPT